jgi:predicted RecB family nuclease
LQAVGVRTVGDLLHISPEALAAALNTRHITGPVVRDWQDQAHLACVLPGLTSRDAQTLVACGVRELQDLVELDAQALADMAAAFAATDEGERLWGARPPGLERAQAWIEAGRSAASRAGRGAAA